MHDTGEIPEPTVTVWIEEGYRLNASLIRLTATAVRCNSPETRFMFSGFLFTLQTQWRLDSAPRLFAALFVFLAERNEPIGECSRSARMKESSRPSRLRGSKT